MAFFIDSCLWIDYFRTKVKIGVVSVFLASCVTDGTVSTYPDFAKNIFGGFGKEFFDMAYKMTKSEIVKAQQMRSQCVASGYIRY